eukprot:876132_1
MSLPSLMNHKATMDEYAPSDPYWDLINATQCRKVNDTAQNVPSINPHCCNKNCQSTGAVFAFEAAVDRSQYIKIGRGIGDSQGAVYFTDNYDENIWNMEFENQIAMEKGIMKERAKTIK